MDDKVTRKNARKARTSHHDGLGAWFTLDNAAVIMPAVASPRNTMLFRVSASLDAPVRIAALQAALDRCAARFHYFVVELRQGAFGNYFEPHEGRVVVEADPVSPCQGFDMRRRGTCLFRVRARGALVACEFSHVLTDGTGGMRFLKNLLAEYYRQLGVEVPRDSDPDLLDLDAPAEPEETEDAYNRYFPGSYPHPDHERPAFRIPGRDLPVGQYRIITGVMDLEEALALARSFKVSLTELMTGVYMESLQGLWFGLPEGVRRRQRTRLSIEVPVNMRQFHPTRTNRNFSLFVHVQQDLRLGRRELPDIVAKIHHQMRYEIDAPSMARHIARNVGGGRNLAVRILPYFIKSPFMRILYSYYGENIISGVLSNLGSPGFPAAVAAHIERLDMIAAPARTLKTKATMVSWKGKLYFTFGGMGRTREVERLFFQRLAGLGLKAKIECNLEDS